MTPSDQSPKTRIQVWCQNYPPEPQGVAPIAGTVTRELSTLGNRMLVVTAHPHYPDPEWGVCLRPYRQVRDEIEVLRLPIWPGRASAGQRIRQDLSSTIATTAVVPVLPKAEAVLAICPSLPGLFPAMLQSKLKRIPWVLWLQDMVTDLSLIHI